MNTALCRKNWQADYYDHVIRDRESYYRIKQYIINNPKNWNKDRFRGWVMSLVILFIIPMIVRAKILWIKFMNFIC